MRNKKLPENKKPVLKIVGISFFAVFAFYASSATAQETIPVTGGNASGSNGSVSYTVGQVVYQTYTENGIYIMEGVQQPYEIFIISSIEEAEGIELSFLAYPNPATDHFILTVENIDLAGITFQMYDIKGSILNTGIIESQETRIETENLVSATYFVKILQNDKEVKTFKIIKN